MIPKLPPPIVNSRRKTCHCNCAVDFEDPCAACPKKRWGPSLCGALPDLDELESLEINEENKSFPSISKMAVNFASAVGSEVKAIAVGQAKLGQDEIKQRYSICENCEFYHAITKRCNKCGCFLKWKTAWRSQKCPIGKW